MKNLQNHQQQGSGLVINVVGNMHVDYFVKTRTIKTYGKYVKWPKGVSSREHIVNVYTDNDCVRLSMVAHFCHEEVRKLKKKH